MYLTLKIKTYRKKSNGKYFLYILYKINNLSSAKKSI